MSTSTLAPAPIVPLSPVPLRRRLASAWHLARGYVTFKVTGRTPPAGALALAHLACNSGGKLNDVLFALARWRRPPYRLDPSGVLGDAASGRVARAVAALQRDGYHVFENRLPADVCRRLLEFAEQTPCRPWGDRVPADAGPCRYDRSNPLAPIYRVASKQVLCEHPDVQRLLADASILAVAQSYIGAQPVLDHVGMWWSVAEQGRADDRAAQLYHVDMPRIRFLKFFVYLVDVGPDNGPHCYVRGSHRRKAPELRRYRRWSDGEVSRHYRSGDLRELTGPQGTIIAADTAGLHKGKPLRAGERLILELEFADSLFGAPYELVTLTDAFSDAVKASARRYRYTYATFRPSS